MNALTELINDISGLWASQMWTIIWQSSVLAGLVLIVSLLFRRISSAVKFWLWMLVPLRLLIMPLITVSLPLLPAIASMQSESLQTYSAMTESVDDKPLPLTSAISDLHDNAYGSELILSQPVELPESEKATILVWPNVWAFLMSAWLVGVAFWTIRLFWGWCKIRRIVCGSAGINEGTVTKAVNRAALMVGLKHVPNILVTRKNMSPFLAGIFRPVLIVPSELLRKVNDDGLLAVFAHEFAHLRRKDTLVGWILAVCEVFYFFHPVLHFVKRRILFERECACDDWVVASSNSEKKTYANALIDAADICRNFSARLGPIGAVAESFGDLKRRLIAIGSNLKPKTCLSKTAFVLLILIGTICVPGFVLTNRTKAQSRNDAGLVQGIVKNSDGQAISDAKISLYHNISHWDFENRVEQQVTSANDGSFRFEQPLKYNDVKDYPHGRDTYIIIATHLDYALGWCNIIKDQEKESYELALTEPQSQTITVTDHQGKPISGVRVWPYHIGNPAGPEPLFRDTLSLNTDVGIAGGTTGTDGKAVITNLPDTRCSFHATLKGYATGLAFSSQKTIKLNKGATVIGAVINEDGKPVENALVKFHTNWGMWQFFLTKTDSQGRFIFEDLPAEGWDMSPWGKTENADGSYVITIEHNDYISPETQDQLMPGDVKKNFIIDAYRGTLVKCKVIETGTNTPLAGVRVQGSNESGRIDGRSDEKGIFTFRVMPGGVSLFSTSPPEGVYVLRDDNSSKSSTRFSARGEEMTVTLEIPRIAGPLTTVRGKVVLPDGSPAANVGIYTTNSASYKTSGWIGAGGAYTGTNPDGTFKLENVPAGLKLFIYGNTKDFNYILAETIEKVENPTELSTPLVMQKGQVADVLFTDEEGKPRSNMSIKITPMMWGNHIPRANEHYGKTDADGHLKINGIIPGMEYFIIDSKGNRSESGWWDNYYNDTKVLIPENGGQVEIRTPVSAVEIMKEEHLRLRRRPGKRSN